MNDIVRRKICSEIKSWNEDSRDADEDINAVNVARRLLGANRADLAQFLVQNPIDRLTFTDIIDRALTVIFTENINIISIDEMRNSLLESFDIAMNNANIARRNTDTTAPNIINRRRASF